MFCVPHRSNKCFSVNRGMADKVYFAYLGLTCIQTCWGVGMYVCVFIWKDGWIDVFHIFILHICQPSQDICPCAPFSRSFLVRRFYVLSYLEYSLYSFYPSSKIEIVTHTYTLTHTPSTKPHISHLHMDGSWISCTNKVVLTTNTRFTPRESGISSCCRQQLRW